MTTVHFGQFCLVIYVFIIAMTLKPLTDIIIQCTIIILSDCHKAHVNRIQHTYKSFKIWYNKLISKVHINTKKKIHYYVKILIYPKLDCILKFHTHSTSKDCQFSWQRNGQIPKKEDSGREMT